ncbi:MAG: helix-turn-helix transcriptional regulator [Coxiellaceae bacterium]|nr:helix-turn-helix transcriptional regulator [Coxiellaceae bacterium]
MVSLIGVRDVLEKASKSFRERRLALGLTQKGLAERSGVNLATLRKFERTGKIAFETLLKLSVVLDYFEPITNAFNPIQTPYRTIDDVLKKQEKKRQRGRES